MWEVLLTASEFLVRNGEGQGISETQRLRFDCKENVVSKYHKTISNRFQLLKIQQYGEDCWSKIASSD